MFPVSDSIRTHKFPLVNVALIALTVFVFIRQLVASNPEDFIASFALISSRVDFQNYPTLIPFVTAMFLHGGFLHLISNMWFLWVFGDNIEIGVGWPWFLFIYFTSGILGNVLQYLFMTTSSVPMLGASGAVAGILGAYYVLFPHSKITTLVPMFGFLTTVRISAPFMLGYWFVLQLLSGAVFLPFMNEAGGIAFWAHVGGFITGYALGRILHQLNK